MEGIVDKGTNNYSQTLSIGHASPNKYRILEDGSQTQYRLCVIESLIPPHSDGPVFHFHEMHDEGFYVTKGKVRFHSPGREHLDAGPGDFVTVPIRLPHKFSNPFDEEAFFINTITPGFFVRYFECLEEMIGEGTTLTPEVNMAALKRFATVPLTDDMIRQFEELNSAIFQCPSVGLMSFFNPSPTGIFEEHYGRDHACCGLSSEDIALARPTERAAIAVGSLSVGVPMRHLTSANIPSTSIHEGTIRVSVQRTFEISALASETIRKQQALEQAK
ncbi:MAG: hypothetical protein Q9171_003578 [Xanthocarpia ochracea]